MRACVVGGGGVLLGCTTVIGFVRESGYLPKSALASNCIEKIFMVCINIIKYGLHKWSVGVV